MTIGQIKATMGTVVDSEWTYKSAPTKTVEANLRVAVPASFDART
jgi:hypothetical protein